MVLNKWLNLRTAIIIAWDLNVEQMHDFSYIKFSDNR